MHTVNRDQKKVEVENIKQKFVQARLAVVTDYIGLKSNEINELRYKLRQSGSELKVVKNSLARLALKGSECEVLTPHFKGTTAVALSGEDPVGPAKVFVEFAKKYEQVRFRAATLKGRSISRAEVEALAKLPSREVLLAQWLRSMMAPARNLVTVLAQIPRQVVNVLAAVRDQKEKAN